MLFAIQDKFIGDSFNVLVISVGCWLMVRFGEASKQSQRRSGSTRSTPSSPSILTRLPCWVVGLLIQGQYFIFAGLVFVPLSIPYLRTSRDAP